MFAIADVTTAIQIETDRLRKNPNSRTRHQLLAWAFLERSLAYEDIGDFAAARIDYQQRELHKQA